MLFMLGLSLRKSAVVALQMVPIFTSRANHHVLSFSLSFSTQQMENGPHAPMYQLLNLFAYGTYCDYKGIFSTGTV